MKRLALLLCLIAQSAAAQTPVTDSLPDYPNPLEVQRVSNFIMGFGLNHIKPTHLQIVGNTEPVSTPNGLGFWGAIGGMKSFSDRFGIRLHATMNIQWWLLNYRYKKGFGVFKTGLCSTVEWSPLTSRRPLYVLDSMGLYHNSSNLYTLDGFDGAVEVGIGRKFRRFKGEHRLELVYRSPKRVEHRVYYLNPDEVVRYTYLLQSFSLRYLFR